VRQRPTKIHLDFNELAMPHCQYFGIAKAFATAATTFVSHEDTLAFLHKVDKSEVGNARTVGPAARKAGPAIETIVARAAEVEVVGNEGLDD
jgi:hypothetical protein